jgi:hypothetical protein
MLVLGRIHIIAQRIGGRPQLSLTSKPRLAAVLLLVVVFIACFQNDIVPHGQAEANIFFKSSTSGERRCSNLQDHDVPTPVTLLFWLRTD